MDERIDLLLLGCGAANANAVMINPNDSIQRQIGIVLFLWSVPSVVQRPSRFALETTFFRMGASALSMMSAGARVMADSMRAIRWRAVPPHGDHAFAIASPVRADAAAPREHHPDRRCAERGGFFGAHCAKGRVIAAGGDTGKPGGRHNRRQRSDLNDLLNDTTALLRILAFH